VTGPAVRLAVLGDPLPFTLSPILHRAGLAALGLDGESEAIPTPTSSLEERLAGLAGAGYLGVNVTRPLKGAVLRHLARVSETARRARSVNTVGFDRRGEWWGDTTDGPGFLDWLEHLGRDPARERVVMLGAGGAARSLGLALVSAGCRSLTVSGRRPEAMGEDWRDIPGARPVGWRSVAEQEALSSATLVVNATPLGADQDPSPVEEIGRDALVLDLGYGESVSPWVRRVRAAGREAHDGLGLLVFQARRSLSLWLRRPVPLDPLARAVGWPR